jgi:hypothetical protein
MEQHANAVGRLRAAKNLPHFSLLLSALFLRERGCLLLSSHSSLDRLNLVSDAPVWLDVLHIRA